MNAPTAAAPQSPAPNGNPARRKALGAIAVAVLLAGAGYGIWHYLAGSKLESTDNAYVQGHLVQVTPQVGGTVLAVHADDTDFVKAGQPLVELDPADARVALEQAEAQLAQTVREVRGVYANNSTLKAQVALREADIARAQTEVTRAQDDVRRREPLLATGAVGKEEFNHAKAQLAAATSALAAAQSAAVAAREQLAANQVLTDGTDVAEHPNVQRAAARVHEAYLALGRAELPAPVDGYVAKRSVQLGQRVQAGSPMMTLVPLDQLWVDANFKENQLRNLRLGQPATLVADVYGEKVEFHGKVAGLGAGTGAAFALLPAQNATGNWIKVVQRVPVRIELDPAELKAHPLRVGLSMVAKVDIGDQSGKVLADAPRETPAAAATSALPMADTNREAEAEIQRIIAANLGRKTSAAAPTAAAARPGAHAVIQPVAGDALRTARLAAVDAAAVKAATH